MPEQLTTRVIETINMAMTGQIQILGHEKKILMDNSATVQLHRSLRIAGASDDIPSDQLKLIMIYHDSIGIVSMTGMCHVRGVNFVENYNAGKILQKHFGDKVCYTYD
jgi:hypothetical protein